MVSDVKCSLDPGFPFRILSHSFGEKSKPGFEVMSSVLMLLTCLTTISTLNVADMFDHDLNLLYS